MKASGHFFALSILGVLGFMSASFAQAPSGVGGISADDPSRAGSGGFGGGLKEMGSEQLRQLNGYLDDAKAINRKDLKNMPQKEVVEQRVKNILDALNLPCGLKNAEMIGSSYEKTKGNKYQTNLYEIACTNNIGYFLTSRDRVRKDTGALEAPTAKNSNALTCFSAEAIHTADLANNIKSELYCQLPENGGGDIKVLAVKLLDSLNVNCSAVKFQWFGMKESTKSEVTEVACDNGTGYLLETALPGGNISPSAMNCVEASKKGLDCKLTKVAKLPTLQTFKDYLATTDTKCKVDNFEQIKVLGKESTKQRYIVEFKCSQQPNGLVAFIPLEGNTNKFETVDCAGIKKYGIACKLTTKN